MIFISSVSVAQVLAAMGDASEEMKNEAKKHPHWFEWVFDRDDLGTVGDQDKSDPSIMGPVTVIHPLRIRWMKTAKTAESAASAQKHDYFLDRLATCVDMGWLVIRPADGSDRQLLDGGHRLHAAYQFGARRPGFGVKVYWTSPR
ncbi:MAG TPA: hypothetical protein VGK73_06950 [Polyangiaceae bacterium]